MFVLSLSSGQQPNLHPQDDFLKISTRHCCMLPTSTYCCVSTVFCTLRAWLLLATKAFALIECWGCIQLYCYFRRRSKAAHIYHLLIKLPRKQQNVHLQQLKSKGLSKSRSEPCLSTKKRERKNREEDSADVSPFRTLFPLPAKGIDMRKETARDQASSVSHTPTRVRV